MTICYFGIYDRDYPRNKNIIEGLKKNGVEVIEIVDKTPGVIKFLKLFKKHWGIRKKYDLMIIGFPGQIIVPLAKLITRRPVVFDLHVSYYDSIILERKRFKRWTLKACYYYFLDWLSCRIADKILIDTERHKNYISRLLYLKKDKIIVVYTGINESFSGQLIKENVNKEKFIISFHGYIQILNGMELVIRAMEKLKSENIELWIIGGGPEYKNIKNISDSLGFKNIIFYQPMEPRELALKVGRADLGLGFFSNSRKIDRVIANKVYELIALKVPVLTCKSKATEEHFKHKQHIYYCAKGDVDSIVDAIIKLKNDINLRKILAENSYNYVKNKLTPEVLGKELLSELELLLNTKAK